MKKVIVFLADGSEEIEALTPVDILRRAGAEVTFAGAGKRECTCSHGVEIVTDKAACECVNGEYDMVVLPGGMPGTLNLEKSPIVQATIDYCMSNDIPVTSICAAPYILGKKGILNGKQATCFPGFEKFLEGAQLSSDGVVTDGNITTGVGPGVAIDFGLRLVEILCGKAESDRIAAGMQCRK